MRAHTITPKARVGARARSKLATFSRGFLALSLVVALPAATANTASAERVLSPWYCPPLPAPPTDLEQIPGGCLVPFRSGPRFDFGDRQVGTTSPAQGFALGVYCHPYQSGPSGCNVSLNPEISVSGDYVQTNNCPPTLSVTAPLPQIQGCLITVTFSPIGTGPKQGTLSTGPGGPEATLAGNGVTTPTPPVLPLQVFLSGRNDGVVERKLKLGAVTTEDSKLVVGARKVKETTKQLAADEPTLIKAKLKHPKRLNEKACPYGRTPSASGLPAPNCRKATVKIKAKATDEFGQTATDELKFWFYENPSL